MLIVAELARLLLNLQRASMEGKVWIEALSITDHFELRESFITQ
jgi:hypothetical protein